MNIQEIIDKPKKQGVSLISCCMDRNENLYHSLNTWDKIHNLDEIIIVDWSSKKSVYEHILKRKDLNKIPKIILAKYQKNWVLSRAFNLGISFASFDKILKIDADVCVSENFLKIYKLNENFFHGSWKLSREPNEDHLHGQLFCKTKDFWDVNGYHEDLTEYGYDDDDLYIRLKENGIKEEYINPNHIFHLVTSHKDRVKNQPYFNGVNIELKHLQLAQKKNKNYCNKFPWTPEKTRLNWNIKKVNDFFYECEIC